MFGTVDVRDVRAHIAALTHPDPPDRCLLVGDNVWLDDVAAQLQALFPNIQMGRAACRSGWSWPRHARPEPERGSCAR